MTRILSIVALSIYLLSVMGCNSGGGSSDSGPSATGTSVTSETNDNTDVNENTGGGSEDNTGDGTDGNGSGSTEDSPSTASNVGQFIDSAVDGLGYLSVGVSGFTDGEGRYQYGEGETVRFSIGDIRIGEAGGRSVITPVELIPGARDETDPFVTNITRFLQTLDDDGDPSNGITITPQVAELARNRSIDFTQSVTAFEDDGNVQTVVADLTAVTSAGPRTLIDLDQAQEHLRASLLELRAGRYSGTFEGDESGTLRITIDSSGNITGFGLGISCTSRNQGGGSSSSQCSSSTSVSSSNFGAIESSGDFTITADVNGETYAFSGNVKTDGTITGIWRSQNSSKSGTFSATRDNSQ